MIETLDAMECIFTCAGQVLYYDTDSVIHFLRTGDHLITLTLRVILAMVF